MYKLYSIKIKKPSTRFSRIRRTNKFMVKKKLHEFKKPLKKMDCNRPDEFMNADLSEYFAAIFASSQIIYDIIFPAYIDQIDFIQPYWFRVM